MKLAFAGLFALVLAACAVRAADLTIHLAGDITFTRSTERVECDATGVQMGLLPKGVFAVEYINGGDNALAIVPVNGKPIIFSNVVSGSGARYAARQYIWWDAGDRAITFSQDWIGGKKTSTCHLAR